METSEFGYTITQDSGAGEHGPRYCPPETGSEESKKDWNDKQDAPDHSRWRDEESWSSGEFYEQQEDTVQQEPIKNDLLQLNGVRYGSLPRPPLRKKNDEDESGAEKRTGGHGGEDAFDVMGGSPKRIKAAVATTRTQIRTESHSLNILFLEEDSTSLTQSSLPADGEAAIRHREVHDLMQRNGRRTASNVAAEEEEDNDLSEGEAMEKLVDALVDKAFAFVDKLNEEQEYDYRNGQVGRDRSGDAVRFWESLLLKDGRRALMSWHGLDGETLFDVHRQTRVPYIVAAAALTLGEDEAGEVLCWLLEHGGVEDTDAQEAWLCIQHRGPWVKIMQNHAEEKSFTLNVNTEEARTQDGRMDRVLQALFGYYDQQDWENVVCTMKKNLNLLQAQNAFAPMMTGVILRNDGIMLYLWTTLVGTYWTASTFHHSSSWFELAVQRRSLRTAEAMCMLKLVNVTTLGAVVDHIKAHPLGPVIAAFMRRMCLERLNSIVPGYF